MLFTYSDSRVSAEDIWIVAFHFSGDLQFYLNENYNCIYLIYSGLEPIVQFAI